MPEEEPDRAYREALVSIATNLWPPPTENRGKEDKPSYFPLPALCARALGIFSDQTIAVNAAWVLLYMASYLLDKIEDQELDHPLVAAVGVGPVANLTTGLILHAGRILAELEPGGGLDAASLCTLRAAFNRRAFAVCAGQHLDLTASRQSLNSVWETISGKSGKFFSLGSYLGALATGGDAARTGAFSQFGLHLGILVQIANDIGGLFETGGRSDLALGKKTLPVVFALQMLPEDARARLADQLSAAPGGNSAEMDAKRTIISSGALIYLSLEADKHRQQAKRIIDQMGLPSERTAPLLGLLDHAIHTGEYYRKSDQAPL